MDISQKKMPPWIDTHCHLDLSPLSEHLRELFCRATAAGVEGFVVPAVSGALQPVELPENAFRAWGVHPGNAHRFQADDLRSLFAESPYRPVAIGECGLDRDASAPIVRQREIFAAQLEIAREQGLPILVHLRGHWNEALDLLKRHAYGIPWVMHAFSGSFEIASLFQRQGASFSFAGSLCMPQARKTPRVAREISLDTILLETDSPDMRPVGWLLPENEPGSLPLIAARLACIRGMSIESIRYATFENTTRIFGRLSF
ncbi:MAG: TatD family hydrolase [Candidatus Riflebacteria bacterium]|nr:TatD family hydrolase [Candidatus Riflebacteria bacterium]